MKNDTIINIQLLLLLVVVVFLYSFTAKKNKERHITGTEIRFENYDSPFITYPMVNKLLKEKLGGTFAITKEKLILQKIEQTLDKHGMIEQSQVYLTVDGKLQTLVKQKSPLARVFTNSDSFYIDYKGSKMPLSSNFSARVPLVYGDNRLITNKDFISLLQTIYNDDFLKKNIIGIKTTTDGNVIMKNRNYNYDILFGRIIFANRKLNNYKAFFQKAVQDTLIDSYKTVNLKFTKQVVCTK